LFPLLKQYDQSTGTPNQLLRQRLLNMSLDDLERHTGLSRHIRYKSSIIAVVVDEPKKLSYSHSSVNSSQQLSHDTGKSKEDFKLRSCNMKSRKCKITGRSFVLSLIVVISVINWANAAAIDDVLVNISSAICDGSAPPPQSFVVYAQNKNTARPIIVTFKYDSNPSSQSFQLYDASLSPYTDRFPKSLVIRIAAGATMPIGCTYNYRPSAAPKVLTTVPIVITPIGAAYVNPSDPNPPGEDARAFAAFLLQGGYPACPSGAKPPGAFFFLNLHPYASLQANVNFLGEPPSQVGHVLPPVSLTRVGCSNGYSPAGLDNVSLVYPPGQMK